MKLDDLTGRKFGILTALTRAEENYISPSGARLTQWKCRWATAKKQANNRG